MSCPGEDGIQDGCRAVDDGEFVVAGGGPRHCLRVAKRLVAAEPVGSGAGAPDGAGDAQLFQQRDPHRRVPGLARCHSDHQRQAVTVDQVVELGGESVSGAAEPVIRRLDQRIVVVRRSPPVTRVMFVACRWARAIGESTETDQSSLPVASARANSAA